MNTKIYFAKKKPDAIIPSKRAEDAGFDIYPCFEEESITICPHQTKMIPTGIASVCDKNYCFVLKERGSTGTKGIAQRCGVIDSGFRGEWFVPVTNTGDAPIKIMKNMPPEEVMCDYIPYPYTKAIAQALVVPVPEVEVEEIAPEQLANFESERGDGALGSSQK